LRKIILDPFPRKKEEIFVSFSLKKLNSKYQIIEFEGKDRTDFYNRNIEEVSYIIGQPKLDEKLLKKAKKLLAVFNVEGNFLPNIDYQICQRKGIKILTPSMVFALPVAELAIGMMISLARGIHTSHIDIQGGKEKYGLESNTGSELIYQTDIGFVGFGDLGRSIHQLLKGFRPKIRVFDPWLTKSYLFREGVKPSSLEEVLKKSRFIFVVAAVTEKNVGMINSEKLDLMMPNASLLILNRAAIADFSAIVKYSNLGKIKLATDVFPEEPLPKNHPIRKSENVLLSAHRAGALSSALLEMGNYVMEDLELLEKGLPPLNCKVAEAETVGILRSNPVEKS